MLPACFITDSTLTRDSSMVLGGVLHYLPGEKGACGRTFLPHRTIFLFGEDGLCFFRKAVWRKCSGKG
jgi:hypothetical protein